MNQRREEIDILLAILSELSEQRRLLRRVIAHLNIHLTATITVESKIGVIDMSQSKLTAPPGTDTLTFTVTDANGIDITSRCTFTVSSDNPAVVTVDKVTGASVPVTYAPGAANLTISAVDSSGDTIPSLVLAVNIATPPPPPPPPTAAISVTAANTTTVIS